ncbi:MAG: hypothetical protein OXU20_15530, partial [Myxococcales bacterium]|nr:hypothetical protein [Myxococcales bacterium]
MSALRALRRCVRPLTSLRAGWLLVCMALASGCGCGDPDPAHMGGLGTDGGIDGGTDAGASCAAGIACGCAGGQRCERDPGRRARA